MFVAAAQPSVKEIPASLTPREIARHILLPRPRRAVPSPAEQAGQMDARQAVEIGSNLAAPEQLPNTSQNELPELPIPSLALPQAVPPSSLDPPVVPPGSLTGTGQQAAAVLVAKIRASGRQGVRRMSRFVWSTGCPGSSSFPRCYHSAAAAPEISRASLRAVSSVGPSTQSPWVLALACAAMSASHVCPDASQ